MVGAGGLLQRLRATLAAAFPLKAGDFSFGVMCAAKPSRRRCDHAASKSPGGLVERKVSWINSGPSVFGRPNTLLMISRSDIPPKSGRIIGWIDKYWPRAVNASPQLSRKCVAGTCHLLNAE